MYKVRRMLLMYYYFISLLKKVNALQSPPNSGKAKLVRTITTYNYPSIAQVTGVYGVLPAIPAIALPILTDQFRLSQSNTDLLVLLVAKRVFIYILATVAVSYAGWRSATPLPAGESLDALNRDILEGKSYNTNRNTTMDVEESKDNYVKTTKTEQEQVIFANLDQLENVSQSIAFALPVILAITLLISYKLLNQTSNGGYESFSFFTSFSSVSNSIVALLFSATEYRSYITTPSSDAVDEKDATQKKPNVINLPNVIALSVVVASTLLPTHQAWPFQNSVNIALAVTITRGIAPFLIDDYGSIRYVALALGGLACYDFVSVFGSFPIEPASAVDLMSFERNDPITIFSGSSATFIADASVMETVARSKFEGSWQPGLLEMVLVGRVSDVIGLGDVVFPACVISWGFTFVKQYAYAAIFGYIVGSLLTEVVSTFGPTQGLPALVFLAPSMLGSVTLLALQRGEYDILWGTNNESSL